MSDPTPFAQWLKQRRRELDLTQEELAEQLNCSVVTISKIEMGRRRPSKQIAELMESVLQVPVKARGDFGRFARGLTKTFSTQSTHLTLPPPITLPLPLALLPLLGRKHELDRIAQLLSAADCHLITIVGPGGVGKTRLALEIAHLHRADFAQGALFVSLVGVTNRAAVPSTIATALGLRLEGSDEVTQQLIRYLHEKQVLLVLDNLEHLLADAAILQFLTTLLANAPQLKIVATSREPMGIRGEWVFRVQGLPVPQTTDNDDAPIAIAQLSAVQLFLQTAQRAEVNFAPDAQEINTIAHICRMVEGMPLAIELAAAWITTMRPQDIADEIARNLDFLAMPDRASADARQSSMRTVFEQSWRLLNLDEQQALARLSVFRGGFSREAAAVLDVSVSALAALLGKSLIRRDANNRYDLHELVRQFAAEKLTFDANTASEAHNAHAQFFLALLTEAEPKLRSVDQDAMLNRLIDDIDNVRVAWEWAVAHDWLNMINAAMRGLARLYSIKSWDAEGVQRFGAAAALRNDASTAHLLIYLAWFHASLEAWSQSFAALDEAFVRIRDNNDPQALVEPYLFRALIFYKAERFEQATEVMHRALALARQIDNRWFEGIALYALSYNAFLREGETVNSYEGVLHAADMLRAEGDVFQAVNLIQSAIHIAVTVGRFDDAERLLADISAVTDRLGSAYYVGGIALLTGQLALARGDRARACQHLQRSLTLFQESHASKQAAAARSLLDALSAASSDSSNT
jgi:predicted ATPase/transcriptional regulator with XRE-family HTH domain